ncbi:MAG: hypothetical protein RIS64_644 [Bacteroidota bacterium]|jgi:hypothetical protein
MNGYNHFMKILLAILCLSSNVANAEKVAQSEGDNALITILPESIHCFPPIPPTPSAPQSTHSNEKSLTGPKDSLVSQGGELQDFTKVFTKTFNVNSNETVLLNNKYGKINVSTGNGKEVRVNVTVTVHAAQQNKANEVFERIQIKFSQDAKTVKTETLIDASDCSKKWWDEQSGCGNSDYSIDYEVVMPVGTKLNISNKYGNTAVAPTGSSVSIDQKYGNFKLDGVTEATVTLGYGTGVITRCSAVNGTIGYGTFRVDNANDISIKSKFSKLKFQNIQNININSAYDDCIVGKAGTLNLDTRYGDFNINQVNHLTVESHYTNFRVARLDQNADFATTYGTVKIEQVMRNFAEIHLKGSYTDFIVGIETGAQYQLDASGAYADIQKPAHFKPNISKANGKTRTIQGKSTGATHPKSLIRANVKYGDLIIR